MNQLLTGLFGEGGLLRVRSLLVLGGGAVLCYLAIEGSLNADALLAALSALAGGYVTGRFTRNGA